MFIERPRSSERLRQEANTVTPNFVSFAYLFLDLDFEHRSWIHEPPASEQATFNYRLTAKAACMMRDDAASRSPDDDRSAGANIV